MQVAHFSLPRREFAALLPIDYHINIAAILTSVKGQRSKFKGEQINPAPFHATRYLLSHYATTGI